MSRKPYLVKFFHAGGERRITKSELVTQICKWRENKFGHARKYVITTGKYVNKLGDKAKDGKVGVWCEWEANSIVKSLENDYNKKIRIGFPENYHIPLLPRKSIKSGQLNTDPCVIGKYFLYSNCKQNTRKGNSTHMQKLKPGDVVVFGSAIGGREDKQFILDTVFVVERGIEFSRSTMYSKIGNIVPKWYYNLTLNSLNKKQHFTLYIGATFNNPLNGMFSFVPCVDALSFTEGFARPCILKNLNNGQTQGSARITSSDAKELWNQVANEVLESGLSLGLSVNINKFNCAKTNIKKPPKIASVKLRNESRINTV